jgi:membrane-anchored protein YejM (alkaline phosphatase superfamily)
VLLCNCLIVALIEAGCVWDINIDLHGVARFTLPAAIISQALFLNLAPAVISGSFAFVLRPRSWRMLAAMVFGFNNALWFIDAGLFRLFHHHLDSFILHVVTSPGLSDAVRPGTATMVTLAVMLLVIGAVSFAIVFLAAPHAATSRSEQRIVTIGFFIVFACTIFERSIYAALDLSNSSVLQTVGENLAMYQPLSIRPIARLFGYVAPHGLDAIKTAEPTDLLSLPKHPLNGTSEKRPNILLIAIEAARFDCLTPEIMPHVADFAANNWWLRNHYSSGNETMFGVFGLFYGIPATYRRAVLQSQKTCPMLDVLAARGYDIRIFGSADLAYTGLSECAFGPFTNNAIDRWPGPRRDRDKVMTDAYTNFLASVHQPFFTFLFYDASHQPYEFPPEDDVFKSTLRPGGLNYATLALTTSGSSEVKKLYYNALHYIDRQIDRVITDLRSRGALDNTIIIIVGDHGEEFGECGHVGHTSGFNEFQTRTLAAMHIPGNAPRVIAEITSHVDFVPTILHATGITNAPEDYSAGLPLDGSRRHQCVQISGWREIAAVNADTISVLALPRAEYFDHKCNKVEANDGRLPTRSDLSQLAEENRRFITPTP